MHKERWLVINPLLFGLLTNMVTLKELMPTPLGATTGRLKDATGIIVVKASLLSIYRNINNVIRLFIIDSLVALVTSVL